MVQNKNTGTDSNAMSRALRFVVLEVSIRLRLIPICTRWLKIAESRSVRRVAVQNVSECAVETHDQCPKDMSNKNESPLGKFFWHQSATCKSRLLAKCPISEKSNWLTARFRISGHNEKQLAGETTKRIGEIKVTLCNDNDRN